MSPNSLSLNSEVERHLEIKVPNAQIQTSIFKSFDNSRTYSPDKGLYRIGEEFQN